ncbi:hypothetical protein TR51_06605 [Kitasatospora griseola]|uniref:Uncharacterized protein n=1 Tax=Kitasatospora griseola TaxID=2064 RepID=A0A0D0NFG7_KITGR|nr:hypothetical protein [Kitasatospora griseola]KIQ67050.1 hypothetical protein TR51_06605 [Kitasatospora griseola]
MIPYQRLLPLLPILRVLLVAVGLVLLSYGLWLIWPPLGFIGGGVSCISVEMVIADKLSRR